MIICSLQHAKSGERDIALLASRASQSALLASLVAQSATRHLSSDVSISLCRVPGGERKRKGERYNTQPVVLSLMHLAMLLAVQFAVHLAA